MKNKTFNLRLVIFSLCFVLFLAAFLSLRVSAEQTEKIGDAYTDGSINTKDAIYVLQYLAYMVDVEDTELYVLNTYVNDNNGDGSPKINSKDALILLQYLAEMDVELGVGAWTLAKEPTIQETGLLKRNEASGFSEYVLPTLNETDYSASITKKAVCFETGVKTYTYTKDKSSFNFSASIPKIDCISVTDKAVAPTCTKTGLTEGSHCEMCNKVFVAQQSVPATGHTEVVDSATDATCTSEGKTEGRHCSACQQIFVAQQTVAKKPHSYSATDWKCTVCGGSEYVEYTSYNEYYSNCTVTENNGIVTLTYNSSDAVGINLDKFALDSSKTYVFAFGSSAGKAKIASNGSSYSNVRISISNRNTSYDLVLSSVSLTNYNTVISSSAANLNLGFYGSSCSISTGKGTTGSKGTSYGALQFGNGGNGGNGGNANIPVVCSGTLNITCATSSTVKGGDGGNGGNGGDSDSSGSSGGNGGNGGNGAIGIKADVINIYFANGKTRSNISIRGGNGGSGGSGGTGSAVFGIGKINKGSSGASGSSALPSNVTINYIE